MEKTYLSIDRGVDKDVVHIYKGVLLSHKMTEIMSFAATWMDLGIIISYGNSTFSLLRTSILFSIVAVPIYILTNNVGGFPFLHTLFSTYYL